MAGARGTWHGEKPRYVRMSIGDRMSMRSSPLHIASAQHDVTHVCPSDVHGHVSRVTPGHVGSHGMDRSMWADSALLGRPRFGNILFRNSLKKAPP